MHSNSKDINTPWQHCEKKNLKGEENVTCSEIEIAIQISQMPSAILYSAWLLLAQVLWRKTQTRCTTMQWLACEQFLLNFKTCIMSQSMTVYGSLCDSYIFILACIRVDGMIHTHHLVLLLAFVEEMLTVSSYYFDWFLPLELPWG